MGADEGHVAAIPNATQDAIASLWRTVLALVEQQKARLYDEIRNYPPPIAGCDQQFNYLLESQSLLTRDQRLLEAACIQEVPALDAVQAIRSFLQSSDWIDAETRAEILSHLTQLAAAGV